MLDWGLRLAFLLALPAAVALWVLAMPLISTLYQYGKFTVNDVLQTRDALLGYSVGLLGLILVKILAPGFYARQDMKTPVKIAFVTVLFAQTLALILMYRIGHAGLTLSTSLGACLNADCCSGSCAARHLRAAARLAPVRLQLVVALFVLGALALLDRGTRVVMARQRAVDEGRAPGVGLRRRRGAPTSVRCGSGIPARRTSTGARPTADATGIPAAARARIDRLGRRQLLASGLRCGQRGFTHSA